LQVEGRQRARSVPEGGEKVTNELIVKLTVTLNEARKEIERLRAEVSRLQAAGLDCAFGEQIKAGELEDYMRFCDQKDAEIERLRAELAAAKEESSQNHTTAMWLSADLATLQGALNEIICVSDEADDTGMGDATVLLKDMMKVGRIAYKALKATTPEQPEAEMVTQ
jgi:uncharacterized small protein (DUF1192 family)